MVYKVWVTRKDGSKFLGSFKNRKEAIEYANYVGSKLGNEFGKYKKTIRMKKKKSYGFQIPQFRF